MPCTPETMRCSTRLVRSSKLTVPSGLMGVTMGGTMPWKDILVILSKGSYGLIGEGWCCGRPQQAGSSSQQSPRIVLGGSVQHVGAGAEFDDLAAMHHRDIV